MAAGERRNNQSEEDYLETILILGIQLPVVHRIEVAKRLKVSQAAVNKAVKLLCARGYVYEDGKHLFLTESGKAYASAVYERHCIIRDYLLARGISPENAESDACKMEHLISEETFQMMKRGLPGQ